jgi:histone acetyltransferase (RNA polymerase elongator complex component)
VPTARDIQRQVRRFLSFRSSGRGETQIAFFGGNFLGLRHEEISACLTAAGRFVHDGAVAGIRFSTRPDTVSDASMEQVASYPVATVELGVQSMDDRVLRLIRRGHTAADCRSAVAKLQERGYEVGCQMMVGLPGDDDAGATATGRRIAALSPDFVRIYPTVVLAGTELARWYNASRYTPLPLEASVDLVKKLYLLFIEHGVRVIRMGLQATEQLNTGSAIVAGPYHPAFGHLVHAQIFLERAASAIRELASNPGPINKSLNLRVNPRDESRLRGLKGVNLTTLAGMFPGLDIRVLADAAVPNGTLSAAYCE